MKMLLLLLCFLGASVSCDSSSQKQPMRQPANKGAGEGAAYAYEVSWSAVEGASSFKVFAYLKGTQETFLVKTVQVTPSTPTYKVVIDDSQKSFSSGDNVCFVVKSVDSEGRESKYSKGKCAVI